MERITKAKANKAAWPGSQPLFNSLRHGITELESQTKELKDARDTVKNIHIAMDKSAWGEACGSIVGHWISTLKVHRSIFQEVAKAIKPLPGAGPTALYTGFSELMEAADDSIENANDVVRTTRKSMDAKYGTHTSTSSGESDTSSNSESSELPDAPEVGRSASKKRKAEHGGETVSLPLRSPDKTEDTGVKSEAEDSSDEDTTWMHNPIPPPAEHYLPSADYPGGPYMVNPFYVPPVAPNSVPPFVRPAKKMTNTSPDGVLAREAAAKRKAAGTNDSTEEINMASESTSAAHKPAKTNMAPPAFPTQKERKSSTEDITGLVDARLEANQAKRKEKKDRKKRKRDSIASSIFSPAQSENGDAFIKDESEPAKVSSKKELPPKKKIKLEAGAERDGGEIEAPKTNDKAANKEAAMKAVKTASKKLKKERAAQGKSAEDELYFAPPVFDDDGAADLKHQKEADDKGGDVQGKKEKKSKRRRSSDEAQGQTHHHGQGKKAKKVKTG